jgi:hypothetical protein
MRHAPGRGAERREPLLNALDPIIVDVDEIDPDEAVAHAIEALGSIAP